MTGTTVGHYEILDKIGEGGMGQVYKARDVLLNRTAALKFLPADVSGAPGNNEKRRRFVQEAQAASALNHPNIVTIYEVGQADGRDFIAMELVQGRSLDETIGRKPLSLRVGSGEGLDAVDRRRGQRVDLAARKPVGAPFAAHHAHETRSSLEPIGDVAQIGLSVANGQMFYASFELQSNIWLAERR